MAWQHVRIARFGGPEVLELAEQPTIPDPGPGEVRIKVLAAGTGFTDTFIRRGRYPDFKGPLPFTPGYDVVGVVEETGPGVPAQLAGQLVEKRLVGFKLGGQSLSTSPPRRRDSAPRGALARSASFKQRTAFKRHCSGSPGM